MNSPSLGTGENGALYKKCGWNGYRTIPILMTVWWNLQEAFIAPERKSRINQRIGYIRVQKVIGFKHKNVKNLL